MTDRELLEKAALLARVAHAELKACALADGLESEWYEVDSAIDLLQRVASEQAAAKSAAASPA